MTGITVGYAAHFTVQESCITNTNTTEILTTLRTYKNGKQTQQELTRKAGGSTFDSLLEVY